MKDKQNCIKNLKCILCDIDGTLYDWSRILSPETIKVIQKLHDKGILLGLASGRPYEELCLYAKEWGFDFDFDVIIGLNGAELYVSHHLYEYFKLSCDTLKEIMEFMKPFDVNPFLYWHQKLLCMKKDKMMEKSAATSKRKIVVADCEDMLYQEENAKIMFRMSEEEVAKVEAFLKTHPSKKYAGFKTQSTLIEFMDPRISKGFALEKLCEKTNIKPEQIMAFGDTTNDNSMLEKAGWGVCLLNGSQDTKDIADEITKDSCSNDGFANYIRENVL
ncbi:Cof-type HAD-IIB family hydrolase [Floccifex sp.]|uniref:Cof-type HAD-IIB family hydrolase n=1 Tax=Floccifex sp. TaxID=2815810 RepID=UPI003F032AF3